MAKVSTTFIRGRMNKSVDERLVPSGEYVDAVNVRLGSTEDTEIGAVENSKGNSLIATIQYAGENLSDKARTIGCFEDGMNETLYWFIHDEDNIYSPTNVVDMIVSFNTNTNAIVYHVISTTVLKFSFEYLITGVSKIENLLFFTDDLNPPRVINVTRNYPTPQSLVNLEEEDIGVIVKPPGFEYYDAASGQLAPLGTPFVELFNLPGTDEEDENYMKTRFLSFAYRYRYEDGQYSATSLFSNPAFDPSDYEFSLQNFWNEGMANEFNACKVTFSTGSKRVKEVQLLYKEAISNVIYVIQRFVKADEGWSDNDFKTITFSNSEIYITLGSEELLRLYDNVPHKAKAQTIQGNRLMYGNYVDGYNVTAVEGGPDIFIDYKAEPESEPFTGVELGNYDANFGALNPVLSNGTYTIQAGASSGAPATFTENNSKIEWDLASILPANGVIAAGTTINFLFTIQQTTNTFIANIDTGTSSCPPWSNVDPFCGAASPVTSQNAGNPFGIEMTFTSSQNYTSVNALLQSTEFKNKFGGSLVQNFQVPYVAQGLYPCNNSELGATLTDKFYTTVDDPNDDMLGVATTGSLVISAGGYKLATGGITNSCSFNTLSTTNPYPGTCATQVLVQSQTNNINTPIISGQLTDTNIDFWAEGVSAGDLITITNATVSTTGLQATVVSIINPNELQIADINTPGATVVLELPGTDYKITTGGNTPTVCPPQGFGYTFSGTKFTLQLPATEFYFEEGVFTDPTLDTRHLAFRYYNFVQEDCTATLNKPGSQLSLHSNRDYEVGIVYMDDYGRASPVLTSGFNTVFFDSDTSDLKNRIKVTLNNLPPYWAKKYKFVVKPSAGDYETIFCNIFYKQDGSAESSVVLPIAEIEDESLVWFKLEGQNANIVKEGDELVVKQDTLGATPNQQKAVVLAVQTFPSKGITSTSLSGLYMQLKPQGWSVDVANPSYYYGTYKKEITDNSSQWWELCINNYPLNGANGQPYDIPQGSIITIKIVAKRKGKGYCTKSIKYHRTFRATDNYANFYEWAIGDDLSSKMTTNSKGVSDKDGMTIAFNTPLGNWPPDCLNMVGQSTGNFNVRAQVFQNAATGAMYFAVNGALNRCKGNDSKLRVNIEVNRTPGIIIFETVAKEIDTDIFYDASELLDIEPVTPGTQAFHKAKRVFVPADPPTPMQYAVGSVSQDQTATQPLITVLDTGNCYTFGNGVEGYRIYDSPVGKSFNLGERVLTVSNQDFKEADRFASITYSGIYKSSANVNDLNEFNLGLFNFKDCETAFGPIQILHARETNVLTLQEDRITYVQNEKNLLSDAVGGGAVVSTPVVLGLQVARLEEYGISFNPESFVSWGYDMFFTDAKRGAIINLKATGKGDALNVISSLGMNSWFRDTFNSQLTTQKLGGYDPYMKEFVLGTNLNTVPIPIDTIPCGQAVQHENNSSPLTYTVELGEIIETITIDYIVTSGSIDISIIWDNPAVPSASVSGATIPGTLTFNKTSTTPTTCTVTVTPNITADYSIQVNCPPSNEIIVRQVILNSSDSDGQTTHIGYKWNDGITFSPTPLQQVTLLDDYNQPSTVIQETGVRSIGMFPYDGANITLRCDKFSQDSFTFNPASAFANPNGNKFRILSSNTDYSTNGYNAAEIASMVTASTWVAPVSNTPPSELFEATATNFSIPAGNLYLYLIWDLRIITSQTVCKCATTDTALDVCCNCTLPCQTVQLGPVSNTQTGACLTDVDSPQKGSSNRFSFIGNASIPTVGDVVYDNTNCSQPFKAQGFYIASAVGPGAVPKRWIQINNIGIVVNEGIC